jgi:type IX secretion system PorP/SprF family membrane protein
MKQIRPIILYACCFGLLLVSQGILAQQEPMYSQYMFNMLQINPAYAGNRATSNVTALYRKQWVSVEGAPTTATISWDKRKTGSNIGYGVQLYNDRLGIETNTGLQAFYSYRIPFKSSFLSLGLNGGVVNYRAELTQLNTTMSGDPLFQEDIKSWLPTAGVGVLYATENWYAGISAPALLKTKTSYNLPLKSSAGIFNQNLFLTTGYIYQASEEVKLKPSILIKAANGAPIQYDFNLNTWLLDAVGIGASYRTGDSFVGMVELQISPIFRLGYAYDYTTSNLKTFSNGTHELMLRYEFGIENEQRVLSPRYY